MANIICGHCGATHATVQEVRNCAELHPETVTADGPAFAVEQQRKTSQQVADEINASFADTPFKPREEIREGFYTMDGDVLKIVLSQTGNLYANKMVIVDDDVSWVFMKGIMRRVERSAKRLTAEEAGKYGKLHGICIICGRTLTNEDSIERGIGPVCAEGL